MGVKTSKINVLVLGLSNSGKTHFIDLVELGENTTKSPTFGYHETMVKYEGKTEIRLIEYGFLSPWNNIQHSYNVIYILLRMSFTKEQVLETKSIILNIHKQSPNIPVCIIYSGLVNNKKKEKIHKLLQLDILKYSITIAEISMDFDNKNWLEGLQRLLEWTNVVGKDVVKK